MDYSNTELRTQNKIAKSRLVLCGVISLACIGLFVVDHSFQNAVGTVGAARLLGFMDAINTGDSKKAEAKKMQMLVDGMSWRVSQGAVPDKQEIWWYEHLLSEKELLPLETIWKSMKVNTR